MGTAVSSKRASGARKDSSRSIRRGSAAVGAWLLIGAGFGIQLFAFFRLTPSPINLSHAMGWEIPRWGTWVILVPLVNLLARRWPLKGGPLARRLTFHASASLAISLAHVLLFPSVMIASARLGGLLGLHAAEEAGSHVFSRLGSFGLYKIAFTIDFHIGILVYWALLGLRETLSGHQRTAELEAQLANVRLDALKMQIHPHFLFNTLNSISALVRKDPVGAEDMLSELGDFLRSTLDDSGHHEVKLEGELDFVERYLRIEKVRLQDRLRTTYEVDRETRSALVPNLLLQPIVENAVHHGIAPHASGGEVVIRSRRSGSSLRIEVVDDGEGPGDGDEGIGLQNTRLRLDQLYGDAARFSLESVGERGTRAVVEIPFHTEQSTFGRHEE